VAVTLGQATVIVSSVVCLLVVVVVAVLPGVSRGVSIEVLGHVRAHTLPHLLHALLLARVGVVADAGDERGPRADEFVFLVFFVRALDLVFLDARLSMLKRVCDASARGEYLGRCLDPRRG
jgi:ABC-type antimicrobial peptide transport system permease subunit